MDSGHGSDLEHPLEQISCQDGRERPLVLDRQLVGGYDLLDRHGGYHLYEDPQQGHWNSLQ